MASELTLSTPPWKQGEDAALALRHRLHLGDGPVNVWDAIRRLDIALALEDFGADGGDGRYINKAGRALIVVNSGQPRVARQRFTAAHELGHHELHRHDRANVVIADDDIFAGKDPVERAANSFAATFLAPKAGLEAALHGKRLTQITPEDVVTLMGQFGLSYEATVNQLNSAGLISRPHRKALLDEAAGNIDWMLQDAGIDEAKIFPVREPLPAEYVERVAKLWSNHVISDVRFAEMLRLSADEARAYRQHHGITRPERPEHDRAAARRLLEELS